MKKLSLLALGMAMFGMTVANAQLQLPKPIPVKPIPNCNVPKIDGDKVPFPLRNANTKFELAENETYLLNGYVVNYEGKTYFKVDFETQPWLATSKRVQFPYFVISAEDVAAMKGASSDLVQMAVVTRKSDGTQGPEFSNNLSFSVITKPIPVGK
jgi:hypothetical protein